MFTTLITEAFRFTAIYLFGSTGETLTEKSGNLNLGIPGIMCFGATGAVIGEYIYELSGQTHFCGSSYGLWQYSRSDDLGCKW